MVIKRIEPLSLAKLSFVTYALMGLIFGAFVSLFGVLAGGLAQLGNGGESAAPAAFGMLFGIGAVVVMPIFYGVMGFVMGFLGGLVYNLAAGWMGGIQIDVQ